MDTASKFNKGFTDDDDDDYDFGRREGSSHKELTVRIDGKSNADQKASTPRSKHSATEQRRRSKINDRFQILRDLIPHSDQKRDKASFLLEVIEYIQFLQEKAQKYEAVYPGWNQENTKVMPWVKVLFRSFWNKAQKNPQGPLEGIADHSQVVKNGPAPHDFVFSGDDVPAAPVMVTDDQTPTEAENMSSRFSIKATTASSPFQQYGTCSGFPEIHQTQISDSENIASQSQTQWWRSRGDMQNEQELTIDEGTSSVSNAYSQWLLHELTHALQSSGIDLSKASLSVQINLGKRVFRPVSNPKDTDDDPSSGNQVMGHMGVGSSGDELEHVNKRQKTDES